MFVEQKDFQAREERNWDWLCNVGWEVDSRRSNSEYYKHLFSLLYPKQKSTMGVCQKIEIAKPRWTMVYIGGFQYH